MSLGYLVAPLGGMQIGSGRRTFAFVTGLNNYGYIAIPVAAAVFGIHSPMMGVLLVCNVGIEVMLWTFGLLILRGEVDRNVWKKLLSPPLVAMLIGLMLNYSGLPDAKGAAGQGYAVIRPLTMLGDCAVPSDAVSVASFRDLVKTGMAWPLQVPKLASRCATATCPPSNIIMALSIPFAPELSRC
jgi:predicted permease